MEVLIEGNSKKSDKEWMGRNTQNTVVVFPKEQYTLGPLRGWRVGGGRGSEK